MKHLVTQAGWTLLILVLYTAGTVAYFQANPRLPSLEDTKPKYASFNTISI